MLCTVHKVISGDKWAISFYDTEGHRNNRKAEFFDRELEAMNRVAELIVYEGIRYLPSYTKEERLAFDFGRTFDTALVPEGYGVAVCFDERMKQLVSESRTESGHKRNMRNMSAWWAGFNSREQEE